MINDYMSLSSRQGFNKSLSHFRLVTGIVQELNGGRNMAEVVDDLEKTKEMEKAQIGPVLNAVLVDRMGYKSLSFNQPEDTQDFSKIHSEMDKWGRLDVVVAYHHPQLGLSLINPKLKSHWDSIREFNRDELVVVYLKAQDEADQALEEPGLQAVWELFHGRVPASAAKFRGGAPKRVAPPAAPAPAAPRPAAAPGAPKPAAPAMAGAVPKPGMPPAPGAPKPGVPAAPGAPKPGAAAAAAPPAPPAEEAAPEAAGPIGGGKRKVTPKYSIVVTNELFHNGNVEAWKNIVESYKAKFGGLDVHIFHDGQKVNNINALFKWGKVKHGDAILFCVSGEEISGVAKLQRYLFEGASLRYTNFLKKDVNKILTLF